MTVTVRNDPDCHQDDKNSYETKSQTEEISKEKYRQKATFGNIG